MTHSHSGVHAQLDALLSADPQAMFAELVRAGLQALIEAEASAKIGADRDGPCCDDLHLLHVPLYGLVGRNNCSHSIV